jgi:hypothetical protein
MDALTGRFRGRRGVWTGAAGILLIVAFLVDIAITAPRVHVRWSEDTSPERRTALEQTYGLRNGEQLEGTTWRYELADGSRSNLAALLADDHVADTAYIDRPALEPPAREIAVSFGRLRRLVGPAPFELMQLQSLLLLAAGGMLLWTAGLRDGRRRRTIALCVLLAAAACCYTFPLSQPVRMGDSQTYVQNRESFEFYSGVGQIRFEAHLSHAILGRLDRLLGRTDDSPERALRLLMHAATAWFFVSAAIVGMVERWSQVSVRYLALTLLAPSALLCFGYRELGHLSLSAAAFPLVLRGLAGRTAHVEAGSALAGAGAALHGFGLLSVAGLVLAAGAFLRTARDVWPAVRIGIWATAFYAGWVVLYSIVWKLPIVPGHAEAIPVRPFLMDATGERLNSAIASWIGVRDIAVSAWIAGTPLVLAAASLRNRYPREVRAALLYTIPSAVFLFLFWPVQGLAVEMDLVFAVFPAVYAAAWVCAHDAGRAVVAAVLLASGHLVFWRVVFDNAFVNSRLS